MANKIKLLWVDTETTGLDPVKNDIIQLAGILEIPGIVSEEFNFRAAPLDYNSISDKAMACNDIKLSSLRKYPPAAEVHLEFKKRLFGWVNPYDESTRLILCGQNVQFDSGFIDEFCKKQNDNFWRSCIVGGVFDLRTLSVAYEIFLNKRIFASYNLGKICKVLGVDLSNAHDAMADIRATRECCLILWNKIQGD